MSLTKKQRLDRLKELAFDDESLTRSEIVDKVVEESGVSEKTVNADLEALFPDGLPDVEPGKGSPSDSTPTKAPKAKASAPVAEIDKGRITAKDYKVPEGEEGVVHVQAERTNFNTVTGIKKSRPELLKVNAKQWPSFKTQLVNLGFSWLVVLHAPAGVDTSHNVKAPASAE